MNSKLEEHSDLGSRQSGVSSSWRGREEDNGSGNWKLAAPDTRDGPRCTVRSLWVCSAVLCVRPLLHRVWPKNYLVLDLSSFDPRACLPLFHSSRASFASSLIHGRQPLCSFADYEVVFQRFSVRSLPRAASLQPRRRPCSNRSNFPHLDDPWNPSFQPPNRPLLKKPGPPSPVARISNFSQQTKTFLFVFR